MQQQQKQDIQAASMGAGAGTLSDANKLALKNLPQDTTDESLSKVLRELAVNPTKVSIQNYDKEFTAFIWFADSQSSKYINKFFASEKAKQLLLTYSNDFVSLKQCAVPLRPLTRPQRRKRCLSKEQTIEPKLNSMR